MFCLLGIPWDRLQTDVGGDVLKKNNLFTKILVVLGNILLWIPILFPFIFLIAAFVQKGSFLFDFLIPAEMFPSTLLGGGLLFWASLRTKTRCRYIGWGTGLALIMLFGSQVIANEGGLASGGAELGGGIWVIAFGMIILYDLALVLTGINGILLMRDLMRDSRLLTAYSAEIDS